MGTYTDTTTNPGWILVDLGAGNAKCIGSVKFYPRTNFVSRINGSIIQGSSDGTNWTDLYTINGIGALAWNTGSITNANVPLSALLFTERERERLRLELYEKPIDKTLLSVLLEEAGVIHTELYQEESIQALQAEATNAQAVNSNTDATQAEIDVAAASLLAALKELHWKEVTASAYPAAPSGKNGWYTSPVTVTLSPAAIAEYSLDGGVTWAVYGAPVTLDQEGTNKVPVPSFRRTRRDENAGD